MNAPILLFMDRGDDVLSHPPFPSCTKSAVHDLSIVRRRHVKPPSGRVRLAVDEAEVGAETKQRTVANVAKGVPTVLRCKGE